jgi:hypothetical protein
MSRIGIIISNHGAEEWTERKLKEEYQLDTVLYFKHPDIDPRASRDAVRKLARAYLFQQGILISTTGTNLTNVYKAMEGLIVASINGEYGFSTACVSYLQRASYSIVVCVYPTSERGATEEPQPDGSIKTVHVYRFVQFREW